MKIKTKTMVSIMIAVLAAGCVYLFTVGHKPKGILKGLDPLSYDISATCSGVESHMLICNEENDMYLYLNGSDVFLEEIKIQISEEGDESREVSYKESSIDGLIKALEERKEVPLKLWMTANGKVECIMIVSKNIENNSETLRELDGLDPLSFDSVNTVLDIGPEGATLAPANYTVENADKLAEFVKNYDFNVNMKFYSITIKETMKAEKLVKRNVEFMKSSLPLTKASLDKDRHAYVWFNDRGEMTVIMTVNRETAEEK